MSVRDLGTGASAPDGSALTLADLPPPKTKRWVPRRKAEIVAAVRAGFLSLDDARERYGLSIDEFLAWWRMIDRHGPAGLKLQNYQKLRRAHRTYNPRGIGQYLIKPSSMRPDEAVDG